MNMNHRIGVLGAGVMGAAIATLAVGHGVPVVLVDVDEETLAKARKEVRQQLKLARLMGKLPRTGEAELVTTTDYADLADVTSVIEAVTEKPEVGARVLAEVSGVVRPGTVIVSDTSAIPVDEMAGIAEVLDTITEPGRTTPETSA